MKSLLLSPHDDDTELFAAFTVLREKPHVIVCTDSYIQSNRGDKITADERANETIAASELLGYPVARLGLHDDTLTEEQLEEALKKYVGVFERVYAPALQGGNIHHDMVSRVADKLFGDIVKQYTTYTRNVLYTVGNVEVVPTREERELKHRALECHVSQMIINRPHFEAVFGRSEWLM